MYYVMTACIMFTDSIICQIQRFPDSDDFPTLLICGLGELSKPDESGYGNLTHVILDIQIQLGI